MEHFKKPSLLTKSEGKSVDLYKVNIGYGLLKSL